MLGQMVGNYRVEAQLGEGGIGVVYLAVHPEIGRKVAVKMLRAAFAEDAQAYGRFVAEARAANAIKHPNIVEVHDFGRLATGEPYIIMDFLEGESLATRLSRVGRLRIASAVDFAFQVAGALAAAHDEGIVHRDLKPDNVFVVADPAATGREMIKVLDFGIAKLQGTMKAGSPQTRTGSLVGTPLYMSPEQCRGTKEVDARTDVYAMGAMLFEMIAGRPPFVSAGLGDLMDMHMNRPPPLLRSLVPGAPAHIEAVVLKAMAKLPDDRFPTATAFQHALREGPNRTLAKDSQPAALAIATAGTLEASSAELSFASSAGEPAVVPGPERMDSLMPSSAPIGVRSRRPVLVRGAVGALAALAVVAGALALRATGGKTGQAEPRVEADPRPVSSAAPTVIARTDSPALPSRAAEPPTLVAAPAPELVSIRVESDPEGATVFEGASSEPLGNTPLVLKRPRGPSPMALRLVKAGWRTGEAQVSLLSDRTLRVPLGVPRARSKRRVDTHGIEDL